MGDYNRSTRECSFESLDREMADAVRAHIEKYSLGPILDDVLMCIESNSEKIKKGLFSGPGPKSVKAGVILTPKWLVQVLKADNESAYAHSVQLSDLVVTDYEQSPFYAKIPDTGVELTGHFTDTTESSTSFLGLGKDAAGDKFKKLLIETVQNAKK